MAIPRMRYPKDAAKYFKEKDPGTVVSENLIRRLILKDIVPSVKLGEGSRPVRMVNLDLLELYFDDPNAFEAAIKKERSGTIRRIG